jgi:hypothetical protein
MALSTDQSDGIFFGSVAVILILAVWKAVELLGWFFHAAWTHYAH